MTDTQWRRYRFQTASVEDVRPLIFNPAYPWWHTGTAGDERFATIVAYLPEGESLARYWDDATEVTVTAEEQITFSGRFPRPQWYKEHIP